MNTILNFNTTTILRAAIKTPSFTFSVPKTTSTSLSSSFIFKRLSSQAVQSLSNKEQSKFTLQTIRKLYESNEPITMMTAHDYPSGLICEKSKVNVCLVGDSLAMVALGYESTNQITLEEMMHHSRAVKRGCSSPFLVGDMPFGTYEKSSEHALDHAIRFIREGHVEAVKMEGGAEIVGHVKKLTDWGVPVVAHIGLTPQRNVSLGGYKVQGKTVEKAVQLYKDAVQLQNAGASILVLEAVPVPVAKFITEELSIPTIGIGAGPFCSGQVLVQLDALGMFDRFLPKFCKVYAQLGYASTKAISQYCQEVKSRTFPTIDHHSYAMQSEEEEEGFKNWVESFRSKSRDI